jgi:HD-GYP domain-containing protein (c-di-GMP phosphodiesterase class II)
VRRTDRPAATADLSSAATGHCLEVREAVLFHREHWDAPGGSPGAVGGDMIPLTSRILAVADAWAGLTAAGTSALTHWQALTQLESRAGLHFDPRVVAAVAKLVMTEGLGLSADTAYAPRVHRVRLPRLAMKIAALASQPG